MKFKKFVSLIILLIIMLQSHAQEKLQVLLAGLSHDHVNRILDKNKNGELVIIGIAETDQPLCAEKKKNWGLSDSLFFKDIVTALKNKRPDLVMGFTPPSQHFSLAAACLPLHIPVMLEKPLSFSKKDAEKINLLSEKYQTAVYTNFPSAWYSSFTGLFNKSAEAGPITKMIMRGGHRGPVEIGCSKYFVNWLTDSVKNGGGAMVDFGCYGALVITALMEGKKPLSVYAEKKHYKPAVYAKVDDAANIVLEYAGATGIIEASWNWPYTIMDVELYGRDGYLYASEFDVPRGTPLLLMKNGKNTETPILTMNGYKDEVEYLTAVLKNKVPDNNLLMSLKYNLVVTEILDAAGKSAKLGKKIVLK